MNILFTNDDGVGSVFLKKLVLAHQLAGHKTFVAAPRHEQSWIGAAKSRHRPVAVDLVDRGLGCPTWSVDGTPADCVNIALAHLLPSDTPIDAVVSGINIGRNLALGFILASGTLGGAWEGALHGLPALAYSQDLPKEKFENFHMNPENPSREILDSLEAAAGHAAALSGTLIPQTPAESFIVHNINFPWTTSPDTEIRRTIPAKVLVPNIFSTRSPEGTHRFLFTLGKDISPDAPLSDQAAIKAGFISHSVLDYSGIGKLPA